MIALLPKLAVYHVTIFVTAVVGFATHHVNFVLDDFAHDFRSGHGLIAVIKHKVWDEHSISVHIGDRTGGEVAAAPCNIHDHEFAIGLSVRQNAVEIPQFIGREQQTFTLNRLVHVQCFPTHFIHDFALLAERFCAISYTVVIIEVGFVFFVHCWHNNESVPVGIAVVLLQSADNIVYRPACSNMQFLALVADFTLSKVGSVRFPQLIKAGFGKRHFDTGHKVIAVEKRRCAVQTSITSANRRKFQRFKALSLAQVDAAVLCICVRHSNVRENIIPQIFSVLVEYTQALVINATNKAVRVRTCKHRFVRVSSSKPCQIENS